jgi:tetratricopeptide (TPR) repeat protein
MHHHRSWLIIQWQAVCREGQKRVWYNRLGRKAAMPSTALCLSFLLFFAAASASGEDPLAAGDAAWARRAEGHHGGQAAAGPIDAALSAYEQAVQAHPEEIDGYWKFLRAIHFKGEYVARTPAEKQAAFGRGREVAEAALDRLAKPLGGRSKLDKLSPAETARALAAVPHAVDVYLWGGADWGLWGDAFGKLAAARQGVADRVRHYGEVAVALDERYADAGGHRLLGRLHTLAPRIPFFTGWVDHDKAVSELRRAVELGPGDPTNALYLAEALLEFKPAKRAEALALLRKVAAWKPVPEEQVEQEKVVAQAQALLARQKG